jgi:hypothetical protein
MAYGVRSKEVARSTADAPDVGRYKSMLGAGESVRDELILEEYRAKWEYLRHLEQLWDSMLRWYAAIVGALAALSLGVAAGSDAVALNPLRPVVLVFAIVYSAFMCMYLLVQKRTYRAYHDRVVEIEHEVLGRAKADKRSRVVTSFRVYFAFPALIGGGLVALCTFSMGSSLPVAAVAAVVYFAAAISLTWLKPYR